MIWLFFFDFESKTSPRLPVVSFGTFSATDDQKDFPASVVDDDVIEPETVLNLASVLSLQDDTLGLWKLVSFRCLSAYVNSEIGACGLTGFAF